jgi:hypothetical protein
VNLWLDLLELLSADYLLTTVAFAVAIDIVCRPVERKE